MKIVFFLSFVLLGSCTAMKYAMNEKILSKENCITIAAKGIPVLEAELEGQKQSFFFDTGAMATVVNDSNVIQGFSNKKAASFGSHAGADRKKKPNKILTVKLGSALFESDNKMVLFSQMPKGLCSKNSPIKGIVGLDAFFENEMSLFLDYSNQRICNVTPAEFNNKLAESSYQSVKSDCRKNQIFVFFLIDGKEYKFKLDTGYTGNMTMPFSDRTDFSKYPSRMLEGMIYTTVGGSTIGHDQFFEKVPFEMAGYKGLSTLSVSTSLKAQNLGIAFMRAFDWLIDYHHNKVYVKRNSNIIQDQPSRKISYYVKADHDKLQIIVKEKSQNSYQLGDQVIRVNGQKVTPENCCELQDLLNKTDDWSTLELEVISKTP